MSDEGQWPPILIGSGFLAEPAVAAMLSEEERARIVAAEAREAAQAEAERTALAQESQAAAFMAGQRGRPGRSHEEVLLGAALAGDRDDRRQASLERRAAEEQGKPVPAHLDVSRLAMKKLAAEKEAEAATPATQKDVGLLKQSLTHLKAVVSSLGGKV